MSKVTIVLRGDIATVVGQGSLSMEAGTVRDILNQIKTQYGKPVYKIAKRQLIAVNGMAINQMRVFATPLNDGDTVKFFPLCGGG
jgi:molybdopterin converting factor small subunit